MRHIAAISILSVLVSCTGRQASISAPEVEADTAMVIEDEPIYKNTQPPVRNVEPTNNVQWEPEAPGDRFNSSEEAYNEGYYNGDQEGYSDALFNLEYGYNYDDTPEYAGYASYYEQGYEDGYEDGYQHGMSQE